jgi:hypothetical protein
MTMKEIEMIKKAFSLWFSFCVGFMIAIGLYAWILNTDVRFYICPNCGERMERPEVKP